MELNDFPDEHIQLMETMQKLQAAIRQAESAVTDKDSEYRQLKHYMVQNRGEIDPAEMFQTDLLLKQIDHTGTIAVEIHEKLVKLLASPYFARIDFREEDDEQPEIFYIGRFTFHYGSELLIFDWRSPVAGMFYDYHTGPAKYQAPLGLITGTLLRKRQFKITAGELEYVIESSEHIRDDVLQKELSQTSDDKMKSIIATIQREQNQIIRNENNTTLIIQGVAGSGKTSIALHRIAYLLYRFKTSLTSRNITILSPNRVFGDYIANVLPELGEEPIYQITFEDIASLQLPPGFRFQPDPDIAAERIILKSTQAFADCLDRYLEAACKMIFKAVDFNFSSHHISAAWMRRRFAGYRAFPVTERLNLLAADIREELDAVNYREDNLPSAAEIRKTLSGMLTIKTPLELYRDFYATNNISDHFIMAARNTLEWSDVFPFLYVQAAFSGLRPSRQIKHLVIDEMQDYTPIQYKVINLLFACPKTILGDFGQMINRHHRHTLEDLKQLYPNAQMIKLNKSYRSTYEIITFASQIQPVNEMEPVRRHGEKPYLLQASSPEQELAYIQKVITDFKCSSYINLAIITKDAAAAAQLYKQLNCPAEIQLIISEQCKFKNGIIITTIHLSKGLEFDEVLIPFADRNTYGNEYDRGLLYIACTRAMHKLSLTCCGKATPLLGRKALKLCRAN